MSNHYSVEFKQKAKEIMIIQHKSIARVSLELGVTRPTLYKLFNNQSRGSRTLASGRATMNPPKWIKQLRVQNEAMKNEVNKLLFKRDEDKDKVGQQTL